MRPVRHGGGRQALRRALIGLSSPEWAGYVRSAVAVLGHLPAVTTLLLAALWARHLALPLSRWLRQMGFVASMTRQHDGGEPTWCVPRAQGSPEPYVVIRHGWHAIDFPSSHDGDFGGARLVVRWSTSRCYTIPGWAVISAQCCRGIFPSSREGPFLALSDCRHIVVSVVAVIDPRGRLE